MFQFQRRPAIAFLLCCLSTNHLSAADLLSPVPIDWQVAYGPLSVAPFAKRNGIMLFGGQYTTAAMGASVNPFGTRHEDNYVIAGAYERDFAYLPYGLSIGGEIGGGARFGLGSSGELWSGLNLRSSGIELFNTIRVGFGLTAGFSVVTDTQGVERDRENSCCRRDARLLGYLGPELVFSSPKIPDLELVYRLHHRSGAGGFFGGMSEGANANTLGLRYRY